MQSSVYTQIPAGTPLADSKLKTDTYQQLIQLLAEPEWQKSNEDTSDSEVIKVGRVVIFCGEDAEARLQAAASIGTEMSSAVYKVNTPVIITRYISHTEKNLDRLFKKASQSNAVLLFEEADTLFAKRTGVRNSHDRYANLEANYLLSQAAATGVVVIISVNEKANIDNGFLRRMRFVVQF